MELGKPGIGEIGSGFSGEVGQDKERIKPLFRGVWSDDLRQGDLLPVGGIGRFLTTKIKLDFESFGTEPSELIKQIETDYAATREKMEKWIEEVGADIDPYLFFVCARVQQKVEKLLDVKDSPGNGKIRRDVFMSNNEPSLSDFKGSAMCAERAALGQHLLKLLNIDSSYVGGGLMVDYEGEEGENEDHGFLVIRPSKTPSRTVVFDIARPRSVRHLPRLSNTDVPLDYELLRDKNDLLVRSMEVLQGGVSYYGIGNLSFGKHNIIEKD